MVYPPQMPLLAQEKEGSRDDVARNRAETRPGKFHGELEDPPMIGCC